MHDYRATLFASFLQLQLLPNAFSLLQPIDFKFQLQVPPLDRLGLVIESRFEALLRRSQLSQDSSDMIAADSSFP